MKLKTIHLKSAKYLYFGLLFILCAALAVAQPAVASPDGFAGSQGTTGGGNASPQTVSSASAFRSAVSGNNAAVIYVNGRFNLGGDVTIGSNKTIIGMNSNAGLYGGTVKIQGTNYIIQNLTFGPSSGDVMEISGATNVFVTKCAFHDSTDELCSIVREADYVTVSWCRFYFDNPDSHSFAHLIGNGDGATGDRGKLHVTLHHNWYDNGVRGRQPRVRFGEVHIYNCYFGSNNTDYCIGTGKECHVRVESSHFDNVEDPWADYGGSSDGEIGWSNLRFDGTSQPTYMSNSYPVFSLPYSYNADGVNSVESIVKAGAGNVIGGTTPVMYNLSTSINGQGSVSPSSGSYNNGSSVTLTASPSSGWTFSHWSGDASGSSNPVTITINSNKSVTANFNQIGSGNMIVRARGVVGDEQIQLVVNGSVIQTWTVSTNYQDFSANASGSNIQVYFTNDNGSRDVQIDYVINNGTTLQSEDQATNTGVWSGSCGGSYSEWLHCNGYIQYTGSSSNNTIEIQENTNGFCSVNGIIQNEYSGASGSGYANTDNANGNGISWSVNAPSSGTYSLLWKLANSGGTNRTAEVLVNGSVQVSNVDFPDTGSWSSWSTTSSVNVSLSAGTNSIRLQATNSAGLANIDYMQITGNNPTAASCSSAQTTITLSDETARQNTTSDLKVYPVPFNNMLTIDIKQHLEKNAIIQLYDNAGRLIISQPVKNSKHTLSLNNLQSGLYLIKISNANKSIVKRIVKQ